MSDYRVNLDIFAGPMDLLLYLVRKEEVDIYDIPISRITDQYLQYVEVLKQLDIDLAGDFLVMAATLMQIKSAMLLPKADPDEVEDEDSGNPRAELIRQLLEYKKFKDAANLLEAAADKRKERFQRSDSIVDKLKGHTEPELDLDEVSIWDLLEAFDRICRETGGHHFDVSHIVDETPIDLYQIEILHRLQSEGPMTFGRVFENRTERVVIVGMFLATLELVRDKLIWIEQAEDGGGLYVRALTDEPAEKAVQRAIFETSEAIAAEEAQRAAADAQAQADGEQVDEPVEGELDGLDELGELGEEFELEYSLDDEDVEVVFADTAGVEDSGEDVEESLEADEAEEEAVEAVDETEAVADGTPEPRIPIAELTPRAKRQSEVHNESESAEAGENSQSQDV